VVTSISESGRFVARAGSIVIDRKLLENEAPQMIRLIAYVADRLGVVITEKELAKIISLDRPSFKGRVIRTLFPRAEGAAGMRRRLDEIRTEASQAIRDGVTFLILSDRGVDADNIPIPALLACAGVHHHLIREETRTRCGLIVDSGEPREVQHFALLTGYGAGAVCPYLALETIEEMLGRGYFPEGATFEQDGHFDPAELSWRADF